MTSSAAAKPRPAANTTSTWDMIRAWPARICRGAALGSVGCLIAALVDTIMTQSRAGDSARAPSFFKVWIGEVGVIAPIACGVSIAFAALALLTHPADAPSFRGFFRWFSPADHSLRLRRGLLVPSLALGSLVWVVACANLARWLLSSTDVSPAAGSAIAAASLVVAVAVGLLLSVVVSPAYRYLVRRPAERSLFRPAATLPIAAAMVIGVVAAGIATGTTSGEGAVLGFFGVFKRPELDLKAPGLVLLIGLFAYFGASLLRKLWAVVAIPIAVIPLVLTVRDARAFDDETKVASTIDTSAPLGKPSLRLLRKLTDRDRDGASAWFGGGDCNDRNPDINPAADDIPSNGIDEDCSGSDLKVSATPPPSTSSSAAALPTEVAGKLPPGLNVLLITVDTLRWDVGYMGNPRPVTPAIDKLAAKSTIYEYFYALASYTGKSIGPLMSGKFPSETSRGWSHYNSYPKSDKMVQERAKAGGIHTIAVHSHWYFKGWSGMGRGFDVLDMSAAPPGGVDATEDASTAADRLSDAAIKVLGNPDNNSKRFFAWVHYFDPHAEYVHHKGTEEFGNKMRDKYDHEVRFTDDQVGRLIEFVQSQPWGKNTAIVISSDHGEAFQEHGMIRHGFEVWEELVRVPFLVYVPGLTPRRIKPRRSAVDMVPTILDLLEVKLEPPAGKLDFISGTSLVPELFLEPGKQPPLREVLVDMPAGPNNDERRAFYYDDFKLMISNQAAFRLFNLKQDPEEKNDLSDDKELLKSARARYDAFRSKLREVKVKRPEE